MTASVHNLEGVLLSQHVTEDQAIDEACRLRKLGENVKVIKVLNDGELTREQKQSKRDAEILDRNRKISEEGRDNADHEVYTGSTKNSSNTST